MVWWIVDFMYICWGEGYVPATQWVTENPDGTFSQSTLDG